MWRAESERTLPISAGGIIFDLLVDLENAPKSLHITLVMRTILEGKIRDDIRELERYTFRLHMLDRKENLRHDILARAGIGRLRVDNVCITFLFNIAAGRQCWRRDRGRYLRAAS